MRLLTFKELREYGVRYCRMHVDRLEKADKFPRRVPLGTNRVAWVADEIVEWVNERIAAREQRPPIGAPRQSASFIQDRKPRPSVPARRLATN